MADLACNVDPSLSQARFAPNEVVSHLAPVHWGQAGHAYYNLLDQVRGSRFDTIFLVPCLKDDASGYATLHHVRACREAFHHRVLIISTDSSAAHLATHLPAGVQFLAGDHELTRLNVPAEEPEVVIARLLIQLAPARIHIIDSKLGWHIAAKFGKAIHQSSRIYASISCDAFNADGVREGLAQDYLPTAGQWLDGVISDNAAAPRCWTEFMGLDPQLFHVAPTPRQTIQVATHPRSPSRRLLSVNGLNRQMRPDFLIELVRAMPEFHWNIHGPVSADCKKSLGELRRLSNVTIHGEYQDLRAIVDNDHLALVDTSAWAGLPSILLDASAMGLPLIASDVGGIRDLVPMDQLLAADATTDIYAHTIRSLTDDDMRKRWVHKQQILLDEFTWENFIAALAAIPGYAMRE